MTLCTFTYSPNPGPGGGGPTGTIGYTATPAGTHQAGVASLVYGTNANNAVASYASTITAGTTITASRLTGLVTSTNSERTRRGGTTTTVTLGALISAVDFNNIRTAMQGITAGPAASQAYMTGHVNSNYTATDDTASLPSMIVTYAQVAAPTITSSAQTAGTIVYASSLNAMINDLNNAGAVCTCNCNYCTCNCNYCTCNCNYSCTCNCNYSG